MELPHYHRLVEVTVTQLYQATGLGSQQKTPKVGGKDFIVDATLLSGLGYEIPTGNRRGWSRGSCDRPTLLADSRGNGCENLGQRDKPGGLCRKRGELLFFSF